MIKNPKIIFTFILILAIFLRFYRLGSLPSSLNWDEISHGYNAYSLLKTGKDQWGVSWPLFNFRAYGDYPTVANLYFTIPFVKYLGLNAFAIRLPAAIFGTLFVVFCFLFTLELFNNQFISFTVMLLAAVSPWSLFPSRAVFQSNLSETFLVGGFYFFLRSLKKPVNLIFSALFFAISLYSYHNTRIAVPVLIFCLFIVYFKKIIRLFSRHTMLFIFSSLIFLFFFIPNFINLFSPESAARNNWVGIINPNSINLINENRRVFTGPDFINRLINNKVIYFTQNFTLNYLNLFNPLPLFFQGSQNYQFNPPNTGLLFAILLPFFYLGLIYLFKKHRPILLFFLVTLLPAALTSGDFPSIRATCALPFYFISIAFGINYLFQSRYRFIIPIIFGLIFIQLGFYINTYLIYNRLNSPAWQYGYQQAVTTAKSLYPQYNQIIFTKKYGEPHEFVLFFWPWDPQSYLTDVNKNWDYHSDWYWVNAFDKFKFVNDWEIKSLSPSHKTLLITSPDNYPSKNAKVIQTINFLDNTPAFQIVSYE